LGTGPLRPRAEQRLLHHLGVVELLLEAPADLGLGAIQLGLGVLALGHVADGGGVDLVLADGDVVERRLHRELLAAAPLAARLEGLADEGLEQRGQIGAAGAGAVGRARRSESEVMETCGTRARPWPKMRRAAGFDEVMMPSVLKVTSASSEVRTSDSVCAVVKATVSRTRLYCRPTAPISVNGSIGARRVRSRRCAPTPP
jgi:hypothetical protein